MNKDVCEISLIEALSFCGVRELPAKDKGNSVWIKSLALAMKSDGTKSYVAMVRDKDGKPKIIKDFGTTASIVKVDSYYPYLYLDANDIPHFAPKDKQAMVDYLSKFYPGRDFSAVPVKELNKEIVNLSVQMILKKEGMR